MCCARDPIFQPWISVPDHSIFTNYQKKSVPEHHHFTFLGGFCRSGDHHFQNFFNFNPFIASHGRLSPNAKRSAAPRRPGSSGDSHFHAQNGSSSFRSPAFSRSKRLKLVPEPRIFTLDRELVPFFTLPRQHNVPFFTLPRHMTYTPPPPPPPPRTLNYLSHCSSGPPVRTHLHTANQRPRVLICIQPIHRGWFNPRYKLPSTARGAVGKATCSTALHCLFSGCEFKSSCWLFFFAIIKWVTMAFIPSEEIPKWWNN